MAHAYRYLTEPEVRFIDAAVSRLIPADELGPGAKEADVTAYIDGQLAGTWGVHGRNYRMGPWPEGTPRQGFQSRFTPQEIYRIAIQEINAYCRTKHERPFDQLRAGQQDDILKALEQGEIELPSLSSKLFFDILWCNTEEGFFADPLYGGNKDKVGWKLIGFPGVPSGAYREHLDKADVYRVEPVSILDVQLGNAQVDAEGFVRHVNIKAGGK
jgi:gluconate 2-dehydrogenase gamma chain